MMDTSGLTASEQDTRDRLILECMALGYLINRTTEYAVFVNLSGHVDSLDVRICRGKETGYNDELARCEFNLNGKYEKWEFDGANRWLEMKRDMLKEIAETRSIPYEAMMREAEVIYHHYF
jgi:hypothetical protein